MMAGGKLMKLDIEIIWAPEDDITVLELAMIVPYITGGSGNELYHFIAENPSLKRHFIIED